MDISYILKKLEKYEAKIKQNVNNEIYKYKINEYYNKANQFIHGENIQDNEHILDDMKYQLGSGFEEICEETRTYRNIIKEFSDNSKLIYDGIDKYKNSNKEIIKEYIEIIRTVNNNTNIMLFKTIEMYHKFFEEFESMAKEIKKCYENDKQITVNPIKNDLRIKLDETYNEISFAERINKTIYDDKTKREQLLREIEINKYRFGSLLSGGFSKSQQDYFLQLNTNFDGIIKEKSIVMENLKKRININISDKYKDIDAIAEKCIKNFENVITNFLNTYNNLNIVLESMVNKLNDCKCDDIESQIDCDEIIFDEQNYKVIPRECIIKNGKRILVNVIPPITSEIPLPTNPQSSELPTLSLTQLPQPQQSQHQQLPPQPPQQQPPQQQPPQQQPPQQQPPQQQPPQQQPPQQQPPQQPQQQPSPQQQQEQPPQPLPLPPQSLPQQPQSQQPPQQPQREEKQPQQPEKSPLNEDTFVDLNNDDKVTLLTDNTSDIKPKPLQNFIPEYPLEEIIEQPILTPNLTNIDIQNLTKIIDDIDRETEKNETLTTSPIFPGIVSQLQNQFGGTYADDNFIKFIKQNYYVIKNILRNGILVQLIFMKKENIITMLKNSNIESEDKDEIKKIIWNMMDKFVYPDISEFVGLLYEYNNNQLKSDIEREIKKYNEIYKNLNYKYNSDMKKIKIDIFIEYIIKISTDRFIFTRNDNLEEKIVNFLHNMERYIELANELIKIIFKKAYDETQNINMNELLHTSDNKNPNQIYTFCKIRVDENDDGNRITNTRFSYNISSNEKILHLGYNDTHIPFYDKSIIGKIPGNIFEYDIDTETKKTKTINDIDEKNIIKIGNPRMDIMISMDKESKTKGNMYNYNIGNIIIGFKKPKKSKKGIIEETHEYNLTRIFDKKTGKLNDIYNVNNISFSNRNNHLILMVNCNGIIKDINIEIYNENTCEDLIKNTKKNYKILSNLGIVIVGEQDIENINYNNIEQYSKNIEIYPYLNIEQKDNLFISSHNNASISYLRTDVFIKNTKESSYFHLYFNTRGPFNVTLNENNSKRKFRDFIIKKEGSPGSYFDNNTIGYINKFRFIYNHRYIFGPYTQIFNPYISNKIIAMGGSYKINEQEKELKTKMKDIINFLNNGKNITIIGYGPSGSGKTSTLIYLNKKSEDGILIHLCNYYLNNNETDRMILNKKVNKLEVSFVELLADKEKMNNNLNVQSNIEIDKINPKVIAKTNSDSYGNRCFETKTFIKKEEQWILENSQDQIIANTIDTNIPLEDIIFEKPTTIGNYIINIMENIRHIEPTPNNIVSSRSHMLVFVRFLIGENNENGPYLIICDFAGVENKFACGETSTLEKFKNIIQKDDELYYVKKINDKKLDLLKTINKYFKLSSTKTINISEIENLYSSNQMKKLYDKLIYLDFSILKSEKFLLI